MRFCIIVCALLPLMLQSCKKKDGTISSVKSGGCNTVLAEDDERILELGLNGSELQVLKGKQESLEDARVVISRSGITKSLDLSIKAKGSSYVLSDKTSSLEIEIVAFKNKTTKAFGREITTLIPTQAYIKTIKYDGQLIDKNAAKTFSNQWFTDGFDPKKWAEERVRDGFSETCSIPRNYTPANLQPRWQNRAGICHAVATATVGSMALQMSSQIKKSYQIPPGYIAMKAWIKNLGSSKEDAVTRSVDYLKALKQGLIRRGKDLSSVEGKKYLRDNLIKTARSLQSGLAPDDIALLKNGETPLIKSELITKQDYKEIALLTQEFADTQENLITGVYTDSQMANQLMAFFEKLDDFLKRYDSLDKIRLSDKNLNYKEFSFRYDNDAEIRTFWENLDKGPLIGSYGNHSVSILGFDTEKSELIIYNSGLLLNNYSSRPITEILPKLRRYWTVY